VTSLNFVTMVTKYTTPCCRANYVYVWYLKNNRRSSTSMSRRSNRLVLLDSKHRLETFPQLTANHGNVAYDLLPYNMESPTITIESNSKRHHCHLMYTMHRAVKILFIDAIKFTTYSIANGYDVRNSRINM